jgi:hypothetical protein
MIRKCRILGMLLLNSLNKLKRLLRCFISFSAETEDFESGRKTKSKEAARNRRNKENDEFKNLSSILPLQSEIAQQLDKASIIRLAISFIKIRQFFDDFKLPANTGTSL